MKSKIILSLLFVLNLITTSFGHSFVTCTDFRPTSVSIPLVDTNPSFCKGYPRRYFFRDQQGDGYGYRPGNGSPTPCDPVKQYRASDVLGAYSTKYPMAYYKKGRDVCIQWPARNHALGFNGPWLNSGTNLIFMSLSGNMTRDPTQQEFNKGKVAEMSFSDCSADDPNLSAADNSNLRPCRGCFKLPNSMPSGYYTFQWFWEFNVGEYYSTCWDAMIAETGDSYTKNFETKPADDPTTFKRAGAPPDFTTNIREPIQVHPLISGVPTSAPTIAPTTAPTSAPTSGPTSAPTAGPTSGPTTAPTSGPTSSPTTAPTSAPTTAPTSGPTSAPGTGPGKSYKFTVQESWPGGYKAALDITLGSSVNGWVVTFDLPGATIVNLWNGMLVSGSSPNLVNNPDWAKSVSSGGVISLGMVVSGSTQSKPTVVTLQGSSVPSSTAPPPTTAPTSSPTSGPTSSPTSGPTSGPTSAPTSAPSGQYGCSHTKLKFTSKNGRLYVNDIPFDMKGTNWFGFETEVYGPHGCWTFQSPTECYNYIFGFLKKNKFNAVRVPITVDMVYNNPAVSGWPFQNAKALSVLDAFIDAAASYDILIMLDIHRLHYSLGISELWYDATWTNAKIKEVITTLSNRYSSKWNVFALDLKNEPHGQATWGDGNVNTDWRLAAEDFAKHLIDLNANEWLIFVEGVERSPASTYNCYWGENLVGVRNNPIRISSPERLVYSPHAYGPSVYRQNYHPPTATNFPSNLNAIWDYKFGYIKDLTGRAVVIGEWGGHYTDDDKKYQDQMALYMISRGLQSNFYWCLNPNSGDTGGLLADDWRTASTSKLNLLNSIVPSPTIVRKSDSNFCILQQAQSIDMDIVDESASVVYEVEYSIQWESQKDLSFGGLINLKVNTSISDWRVYFSFPEGQTIQQVTNAKVISAGPDVILGSLDSNKDLSAKGEVQITFVAKFTVSNNSPYQFSVGSGEDSPVLASSSLFEKNELTPTVPPGYSDSTPTPSVDPNSSSSSSLFILSFISTLLVSFLSLTV